jgi:hypothetical protein
MLSCFFGKSKNTKTNKRLMESTNKIKEQKTLNDLESDLKE